MRGRRAGGFSLVELLVAVGIIGILSAIAMMYYQGALIRSKQKRTMADMRSIGAAWEARAVDTRQYNAAGGGFTAPPYIISYADMQTLLTPQYIKVLPRKDAWGHDLVFSVDARFGGTTPANEYAIRSPGRDGQLDTAVTPGTTTDSNADIVYSNGVFIQYPATAGQ